jgi:transposase
MLKRIKSLKKRRDKERNNTILKNKERLRERDKLRYATNEEFKQRLKDKYKEQKQQQIDDMIKTFYESKVMLNKL